MHNDGETTGPTEIEARRSLLKKIGVAGAAAWVAPTVLSSSAFAQGSSGGTLTINLNECGEIEGVTGFGCDVNATGTYHVDIYRDFGAGLVFSTCLDGPFGGISTSISPQAQVRFDLISGTCAAPGVLLDSALSVNCF